MAEDNKIHSLMVDFLCDLKNEIIKAKGEEIHLRTGYLTCAHYIDTAVDTLLKQQTEIETLRNRLDIEMEYSSEWGDFFGYTPKEMTKEEQLALKKHMKIFEDQWKKNMEAEA